MHVDPLSTDAFNALISGHKWWVYLPCDVYEYDEELSCDEKCSDFSKYDDVTSPTAKKTLEAEQMNEMWFAHILPQIR